MKFQLTYRRYKRRFRRPVRFGSSIVDKREGIVLRLLREDGRCGYGEIAPIESFGSESVDKAGALLKSFCGLFQDEYLKDDHIHAHPCTNYALKCALNSLQNNEVDLPEGRPVASAKLAGLNDFLDSDAFFGRDVLKLKVGEKLQDLRSEWDQLEKVFALAREQNFSVRLDANEQLTIEEAERWIEFLLDHTDVIQFFEQPIDRTLLDEMLVLSKMGVPLALDESISLLRGQDLVQELSDFYFIIKPSLGDCGIVESNDWSTEKLVISSVFESAFGFSELLRNQFRNTPGLDTQEIFVEDDLVYPSQTDGKYRANRLNLDELWQKWG